MSRTAITELVSLLPPQYSIIQHNLEPRPLSFLTPVTAHPLRRKERRMVPGLGSLWDTRSKLP